MVEPTEPDAFDLLVAAAAGVAIAVVSKDEASRAAGHNGVTADGSLRGTQTGSQTAETQQLAQVNTNSSSGKQTQTAANVSMLQTPLDYRRERTTTVQLVTAVGLFLLLLMASRMCGKARGRGLNGDVTGLPFAHGTQLQR